MSQAMAIVMVVSTWWVHQWPQLWTASQQAMALIGLSALGVLCWLCRSSKRIRWGCLLLGTATLAVLNTNYQAQQRVQQQLPTHEENKAFKLRIQIEGLAQLNLTSRSVTARVLNSHPLGVPEHIMLVWSSGEWGGPYAKPAAVSFPELIPGQQWAVTAYIKTPHGARNPGGFDYEGYVFSQGIRAVAQVRGQPELLSSSPISWSVSLIAQRWRHHLRAAMLPYLESLRWGGVILALSIGDQASIDAADWRTFNRTGLTHLVSISGSHVTLLASVAALLCAWGWRRLYVGAHPLAQYIPAQLAAAWLAWWVAGIYSLIAGWAVPARRTFFMFSVMVFSLSLRLPLRLTQIVAIAALGVMLFDPWSVLASGFWLSFGAVLLLVQCAGWSGVRIPWQKLPWLRHKLQQLGLASQWQLVISVALLPPLAFLFFEMSLVSPASNAYGIPLIGLVITPLALLFAILSVLQLESLAQLVLWLCHWCLEWTMWPTEWLAQLPLASLPASKAPAWVVVLAMLGVSVALLPKAWPGAWLGWGLVLPALFWRPTPLNTGEWRLHVLDIGQGSAVLIETAQHNYLFDAGVRRSLDSDEGARTLVPYLHSLGKQRLDGLILSHADLDHVGGALSVLERIQVDRIYSSFDVAAYHEQELHRLSQTVTSFPALPQALHVCQWGKEWEADGVRFQFYWPSATQYESSHQQDKNGTSCVLGIHGTHYSAVLTGDIGHAQEQQLVEAGIGPHEVVVVGHHGSKTSSSALWVQHMQAQVALAQVGWWSRFGHPHTEVEQRWNRAGARFYRTDFDGAVLVRTEGEQLHIQTQRQHAARYWQNPFSRAEDKGKP